MFYNKHKPITLFTTSAKRKRPLCLRKFNVVLFTLILHRPVVVVRMIINICLNSFNWSRVVIELVDLCCVFFLLKPSPF